MKEEQFNNIKETLEELISKVNSFVDDGHEVEQSWIIPYVTGQELANYPNRILQKLEKIDFGKIEENLLIELINQNEKLEELAQSETIEQMFNTNAKYAIPAYMEGLRSFESILSQCFDWESIDNPNTMPKRLSRRIKSIDAQVNEIEPNIERLKDKIASINEASETAEKLPIDLESLKTANLYIEEIKQKASEALLKIETDKSKINKLLGLVLVSEERATKVADYCDEVHGIATSVGLSASFTERASKTSTSMWFWIAALFMALGLLMFLGYDRLESFNELIKVSEPNWGALWMNLFLSILGIAAPGWLAWISTKQIAQRFKIAEDYKYKAAVAKAYEGYKKEAAIIDPALAYRLFDTTLTRLEEPPLRLMEKENHGSPINEFLNSPHMEKLIEKVPEVKNVISELKGVIQTKKEDMKNTNEE